jgi:hypothetical protein
MAYSERTARGPGLAEARALDKSADLDHISVYAAAGATADNPRWIVCHYSSEDDQRPTDYLFSDGHELLAHIANVVNVPNENESDEDDEGGY